MLGLGIGVGAALAGGSGVAHADSPAADSSQADLGQPAQLGAGSDAQRWTVSGLRPSSDALPYQPVGKLWEATATGQLGGGGIPVIPGFTARGGGGAYPVLWGVASPQGINPASLPPGGAATGKIYFDVTGGSPSAVAYTADGQDIAVWVQPSPPPAAGGMSVDGDSGDHVGRCHKDGPRHQHVAHVAQVGRLARHC